MKKCLIVLVIILLMTGCSGTENAAAEKNKKINEDLLAIWEKPDSYDPMDTVVKTEKRSAPDHPSDLTYAIFYLNKDGVAVKIDIYYLPEDILMYSVTSYDKGLYTYKNDFVFNREFYDNFSKYKLPQEFYRDFERQIYHNGIEQNALGLTPDVVETFYPDGSKQLSIVLLAEDGQRYTESDTLYDVQGNIIRLFKENPQRKGMPLYTENNIYEDGKLVYAEIFDYGEGVASRVTYVGGEVAETDVWSIDEHGDPINQ